MPWLSPFYGVQPSGPPVHTPPTLHSYNTYTLPTFTVLQVTTMSTSMIALPENSSYWRNALFHLETPVFMSSEEYNTYWPMVDSVYKKFGGNLRQKKGTVEVQKYEYRLRKSQKSGTAQPATDEKKIKRCHTSIRIAGQCEVQIKVTRSITRRLLQRASLLHS